MVVEFSLIQTFWDTVSGLIKDLPIIIIIIWVIRVVERLGKELIKNIPSYIEQYFKLRENQMRLEWARGLKHE